MITIELDKMHPLVTSLKLDRFLLKMALTQIVLLALFSPSFKLLKLLLLLQCTKMSTPSKLHIRELIINFVLKNPSIAKSEIVRRFSASGVASSTVNNVLNKGQRAQPKYA